MKSIKQVAETFGVDERTVSNWIKKGIMKSFKIGGTVRIDDEEVERVLENAKRK